MQQPAQQIASTYLAGLIRPDSGRPGRRVWRGEPKCPVWTVPVVVLDVDPEHML
jgi:hypothetical protein